MRQKHKDLRCKSCMRSTRHVSDADDPEMFICTKCHTKQKEVKNDNKTIYSNVV